MDVALKATGSGGWPLNVIMTPDQKPFFVGTYIPKESRFGRTGLLELVPRVMELWNNERQKVLESANQITTAVQQAPDRRAETFRPERRENRHGEFRTHSGDGDGLQEGVPFGSIGESVEQKLLLPDVGERMERRLRPLGGEVLIGGEGDEKLVADPPHVHHRPGGALLGQPAPQVGDHRPPSRGAR